MKRIRWFLPIFFLIIGCDSNNNNSVAYTTDSQCGAYSRVSFDQLLATPQLYDGKTVEVSGYYHHQFEQSSISSTPANGSSRQQIWVNGKEPLTRTEAGKAMELWDSGDGDKLQGKRITIRGKVNAKDKGHMDEYALAIDVCFLQFTQ